MYSLVTKVDSEVPTCIILLRPKLELCEKAHFRYRGNTQNVNELNEIKKYGTCVYLLNTDIPHQLRSGKLKINLLWNLEILAIIQLNGKYIFAEEKYEIGI